MSSVRVIVKTAPSWFKGESQDQAEARRRESVAPGVAADRYPHDYAGQVLAALPMERAFGSGDLADPSRRAAVVDVTDDAIAGLRSGTLKLLNGRPHPVTFDDRWGAVGLGLKARGYTEAEIETITTGGGDPANAREFSKRFRECLEEMGRPEVHTGVGLYPIGPGQTYSTWTSAANQLGAEQGAAPFTKKQELRGYADTYTETVTIPSYLAPNVNGGFGLLLAGDPSTARANVILQGAGGNNIILSSGPDQVEIRHLTLKEGFNSVAVALLSYIGRAIIQDVAFLQPLLNRISLSCVASSEIRDCLFDCLGITTSLVISLGTGEGFNTVLRSQIKAGGTGLRATFSSSDIGGGLLIRASTFQTGGTALQLTPASPRVHLDKCGFYQCGDVLLMTPSLGTFLEMSNCIALDTSPAGHVIVLGQNPEETPDHNGPGVVLRTNIFTGQTNFANCNGVDKTHAEFVAFNRVDEDGDIIGANPLWTDPGNFDYSTGSGSPARGAGKETMTLTDYLGQDYGAPPDIGPWSSGVVPTGAPDRPEIVSAEDDVTGTSATLELRAADEAHELVVYTRLRNEYEYSPFETTRIGSGPLQVTGLTQGSWVAVAEAKLGDEFSRFSDPVAFPVTAGTLPVEESLKSLVTSAPAIAALIAKRYYYMQAPQDVSMPYLVVQKISTEPFHNLRASDRKALARFQFDILATRHAEARAIAKALRALLDGYDSQIVHGNSSNDLDIRLEDERDGALERPPGAGVAPFKYVMDFMVGHDVPLA